MALFVADEIYNGDENMGHEGKLLMYKVVSYTSLVTLIACNMAEEVYERYVLLPVPWLLLILLKAAVETFAFACFMVQSGFGFFGKVDIQLHIFGNAGFYFLVGVSLNFNMAASL